MIFIPVQTDEINMNGRHLAGVLFVIAVGEFFIGMMMAEATYPGYNISSDTISQLGSMVCHGSCRFIQPAADIFNISVTVLGVIILIGGAALFREDRPLSITVVITGLGAIGVGLTLAAHSAPILHGLVSLITFVFAGISALLSVREGGGVFAVICLVLGILSLASTVLFTLGIYMGLGIGGMERMIVYPVLVWGASFGGYLISKGSKQGAT